MRLSKPGAPSLTCRWRKYVAALPTLITPPADHHPATGHFLRSTPPRSVLRQPVSRTPLALTRVERRVALVLADLVDDRGVGAPGCELLAVRTGLARETVSRCLTVLERHGLLVRLGRRGEHRWACGVLALVLLPEGGGR
jgi:hypothetical protein